MHAAVNANTAVRSFFLNRWTPVMAAPAQRSRTSCKGPDFEVDGLDRAAGASDAGSKGPLKPLAPIDALLSATLAAVRHAIRGLCRVGAEARDQAVAARRATPEAKADVPEEATV